MWGRTSRLKISARPWGVNLMTLPNRCTRSIILSSTPRQTTSLVPRCFGGTSASGPSYRWIRTLVSRRLPCEKPPCRVHLVCIAALAMQATPQPVADLRHILTMLRNVLLVLQEFVADRLFGIRRAGSEPRDAVNDIGHEMEPVQIIQDRHIERRRRGAFFLVAAHVEIGMIGAAVGEPVNQPRVAMEGKDDRLVLGEQHIKLWIAQAVRVCTGWLELHEVHHVDDPDLQVRRVGP